MAEAELKVRDSAAQASGRRRHSWRLAALGAGWGLVLLGVGWELWWAPLRPGGSWLALKVLPLLLLVPAMARGGRRAYQWTTLLVLGFVCEGVVRAMSEGPPVRILALCELLLALTLYVAAIGWLRADRHDRVAATLR